MLKASLADRGGALEPPQSELVQNYVRCCGDRQAVPAGIVTWRRVHFARRSPQLHGSAPVPVQAQKRIAAGVRELPGSGRVLSDTAALRASTSQTPGAL